LQMFGLLKKTSLCLIPVKNWNGSGRKRSMICKQRNRMLHALKDNCLIASKLQRQKWLRYLLLSYGLFEFLTATIGQPIVLYMTTYPFVIQLLAATVNKWCFKLIVNNTNTQLCKFFMICVAGDTVDTRTVETRTESLDIKDANEYSIV